MKACGAVPSFLPSGIVPGGDSRAMVCRALSTRPLPSPTGPCTGPFPGGVSVRSRTLPRSHDTSRIAWAKLITRVLCRLRRHWLASRRAQGKAEGLTVPVAAVARSALRQVLNHPEFRTHPPPAGNGVSDKLRLPMAGNGQGFSATTFPSFQT